MRLIRLADEPGIRETESWKRSWNAWPQFMHHDPIANEYFGRVRDEFPQFQLVLLDGDEVVAHGDTAPVAWDGTPHPRGVDWALATAFSGAEPTTLCALQVVITPEAQGRGLSTGIVREMASLASDAGLDALIAPVRPSLKHRYPLTPIERYVRWRRADGLLLDPWLRVHERLGAEVLAVAPESMRIPGTVAQWEEWTGMAFPDGGDYVVEGALVPVHIDRDRDEGLYVEPNVWMKHRV
jgi:GNAT superfamily N-acetyltransferase